MIALLDEAIAALTEARRAWLEGRVSACVAGIGCARMKCSTAGLMAIGVWR